VPQIKDCKSSQARLQKKFPIIVSFESVHLHLPDKRLSEHGFCVKLDFAIIATL
jgi:hypothetical protein